MPKQTFSIVVGQEPNGDLTLLDATNDKTAGYQAYVTACEENEQNPLFLRIAWFKLRMSRSTKRQTFVVAEGSDASEDDSDEASDATDGSKPKRKRKG